MIDVVPSYVGGDDPHNTGENEWDILINIQLVDKNVEETPEKQDEQSSTQDNLVLVVTVYLGHTIKNDEQQRRVLQKNIKRVYHLFYNKVVKF